MYDLHCHIRPLEHGAKNEREPVNFRKIFPLKFSNKKYARHAKNMRRGGSIFYNFMGKGRQKSKNFNFEKDFMPKGNKSDVVNLQKCRENRKLIEISLQMRFSNCINCVNPLE